MDNFLTRAIKRNPRPCAIIGIVGGLILLYCSLSNYKQPEGKEENWPY